MWTRRAQSYSFEPEFTMDAICAVIEHMLYLTAIPRFLIRRLPGNDAIVSKTQVIIQLITASSNRSPADAVGPLNRLPLLTLPAGLMPPPCCSIAAILMG